MFGHQAPRRMSAWPNQPCAGRRAFLHSAALMTIALVAVLVALAMGVDAGRLRFFGC